LRRKDNHQIHSPAIFHHKNKKMVAEIANLQQFVPATI